MIPNRDFYVQSLLVYTCMYMYKNQTRGQCGLTQDCRHLAANAYIHISEAFNCQKYISRAQFGVSAYFDRTPLKGVNPLIL